MAPHYVRVYSPAGEPFDVNVDKASELILNSGWTRTRTVDAEPNVPHVTSSYVPAANVADKGRRRSRRFKAGG